MSRRGKSRETEHSVLGAGCWGRGGGGGDGLVAMEFHVGATDTFWDQTDMVAGGHRIVHIKMLNFMYVGFTTNFFFF